jgi:hypothetical protein
VAFDVLVWIVTGVALLISLAVWVRVTALKRRVDQLTRDYWELRYKFGELRAQVARLDPDSQPQEEPPAVTEPTESFVPLSSLKR